MIYELLDTDAHPLVVVGTHENHPDTDSCECGSSHRKALAIHVDGAAPAPVKAVGLLSAIATLLADSDTDEHDRRAIRRGLAMLLEVAP